MQWGELSQKMYQKSSALSIRLEFEEVSLQIEFTTLPPKNHNLFVKNWNEKGIGEKRNCGHRLIMHSITRREKEGGGWGWSEKTVGGGGTGGSFTQTYVWAGWNSMTMHINFSILLLKRDFYLLQFKSKGQQKPGDVSPMQSDYKCLHWMLL
jgi:hypothetical protein